MKLIFKNETKRTFQFTCEPFNFLKKIPGGLWKAFKWWLSI